jgi:hypothetical protein
MAPKSHCLHKIPEAYATYTVPLAASPPADERCFICRRVFGEEEGEEVDDVPCHALQFSSCGHFIGSECLHDFMDSNLPKQCPFCFTPLEHSSAIENWLAWLSSTRWFKGIDETTAAFIAEHINLPDAYKTRMYERLFARELTVEEAYGLWYCHCHAGLRWHIWFTFKCFIGLAIFWLLTRPWGTRYPELVIFAPSWIDPSSRIWCSVVLFTM